METEDTLPDTPSDLILAALGDFVSLLTEPGYAVDMDIWHQPTTNVFDPGDEICKVCFAGAVMAKRLEVGEYKQPDPLHFSDKISNKLFALDCFRRGYAHSGLRCLGCLENPGKVPYYKYPIPEYGPENPHLFVEAMRGLTYELKECGF